MRLDRLKRLQKLTVADISGSLADIGQLPASLLHFKVIDEADAIEAREHWPNFNNACTRFVSAARRGRRVHTTNRIS